MKEFELLKKLHDTNKKYCAFCEEAKHISKFRRTGTVKKTCNECHARHSNKDTINNANNIALALMDELQGKL